MTRRLVIFLYLIVQILADGHICADNLCKENYSENSSTDFYTFINFFREALKCCPTDHSYDPMTRVCSSRSTDINSKWKILDKHNSAAGTLTCDRYRVLVDYEIFLTFTSEGKILETTDGNRRSTNASAVDCDNSECDGINGTQIYPLESTDHDLGPEFQSNASIDVVMRIVSAGIRRVAYSPSDAKDAEEGLASFLPGGMLGIDQETHAPSDFCLNVQDGTVNTLRLTARVCQEADRWCTAGRTCFRKCCPDGQIMVERELLPQGTLGRGKKKRICYPHPTGFATIKLNQSHHDVNNGAISTEELGWQLPLGVYNGEVCAREKYRLDPAKHNDKWELNRDGSLFLKDIINIGPKNFTHAWYCLETIRSRKKGTVEEISDIHAYLCFPEQVKKDSLQHYVHGAAISISCVFLLATLVAYAILPSLRNLHGVTLVTHASCLLAAFICLAIAKFTQNGIRGEPGCKVLGFLILFSFLAAFSWLSVMCFDIWWTFGQGKIRAKPGTRGMSSKSGGALQGNLTKFIWYSIYAWTLPTAFTTITALADAYGESLLPSQQYRKAFLPMMGSIKCWFQDNGQWAVSIFFVGPSSILLFANVVMYTLTAVRCWKIKAEIQRMQHSEKGDSEKEGDSMKKFGKKWWKQTYKADKDRFYMNLKLCSAMGTNWILEIVSWWLTKWEDSANNEILPKAIWFLSDVANCLHGVSVFIVFVGKKKILVQLWKKIKGLSRCCPHGIVRDEGRNTSQRGNQSYNTSSLQDIDACNEDKTYNFNDDDGRRMGRIRRWLVNHCFHSRKKKYSTHSSHSMGKESTTTTSISGDICHGSVSYVP